MRRCVALRLAALVLALVASTALAAPAKKVFVLGVDGLDPVMLQSFMDRGLLPNIKQLADKGDFKPLQTSMPPLSPVAWSTFITGMDAGGHGVFDFIHRDPVTLFPTRAESGVHPATNLSVGECTVLPLPWPLGESSGPRNLRNGKAFWQILEEADIPTTVYRIPANFPPVESAGRALSGMGTPDIRGTPGTFSFYTDRRISNAGSFTGGKVYPVQVKEGRVSSTSASGQLKLHGPPRPFLETGTKECRKKIELECKESREPECGKLLEVPFDVFMDPEEPVALFNVQDKEFLLQEGEWSDWIRVDFKALPAFASVSAIGRFYLKQVRPEFELYVTPLQINPEEPGGMQISTPKDWSHELCEELGYFYTQELAEDTKALTYGVLDGHEFWQQSQFVFDEQQQAFDLMLEEFDEGLLFYYFSSVDQRSHMLWNYIDPDHPGFIEDEMLHRGLESVYIELDGVVGRALAAIDDETTFIIMSDHGFGPFYWQVNLNTWLLEKGYVTLIDPSRQGQSILFSNVDWTRTKAYAVGLNGLYVNLRGREKRGIVNRGEDYDRLLQQLEKDLLAMVDPRNEHQVVTLVVNSGRDLHGPLKAAGPDLIVGYNRGYRSSWRSPLGEFPREIFADNKEPWSGDHSVDYRHVPGVLITNRPITLEEPALYDLTVAILDEYGVEKPEEMIGRDCLGE